jgi:hypothetical protein
MGFSRMSRDPRWLESRFPAKCSGCGVALAKGVNAFWVPASKSIYCEKCGKPLAKRFNAEVADEEFYSGGGGDTGRRGY